MSQIQQFQPESQISDKILLVLFSFQVIGMKRNLTKVQVPPGFFSSTWSIEVGLEGHTVWEDLTQNAILTVDPISWAKSMSSFFVYAWDYQN